MDAHPTWIVAVNEHAARLFLRRKSDESLVEFDEFADSADLLEAGDPEPADLVRDKGRIRFKPRRRKKEEVLKAFLRRVASRIDQAMTRQNAKSLAICAPPHVLGLLRDLVSHGTRDHLVSETCADLVREPAANIDSAMRAGGL